MSSRQKSSLPRGYGLSLVTNLPSLVSTASGDQQVVGGTSVLPSALPGQHRVHVSDRQLSYL